jgi:1-deoxy-D-xylulose-5-phosphate synthase
MGKGVLLRDGSDGAIVAYGAMVYPVLEAAGLLAAEGINPAVVNARFAKPLDEELFINLAGRQPFILAVEDHGVTGGFGSALAELITDRGVAGAAVFRLGVPERFIEHGDRGVLLKETNLSPQGIYERFKNVSAKIRGRAGKQRFGTGTER